MLRIASVEPLKGRSVRLTLTDGSVVVRDLRELLDGHGVFSQISGDDDVFAAVFVDSDGTIAWPGDVDLAPETVIWDGPDPADHDERRPEPFLRLRRPTI